MLALVKQSESTIFLSQTKIVQTLFKKECTLGDSVFWQDKGQLILKANFLVLI
jgi:hypothetical protein